MASTISVDTIQGSTVAGNVKLPEGCVIGYKTAAAANSTQITGTTYTDITNMTLDYACKYSTSIVYVVVNVHVFIPQQATTWQSAGIKILRGSSALYTDVAYGVGHYTDSANDRFMHNIAIQAATTPGDTNSQTYKVQGSKLQGTSYADFNNGGYSNGGRITVMEIAQ